MNRKRVVVLARAGAARDRTEAAIVQAGAEVAALLDPATAAEDDVRAASPDVLLVILDALVEQAPAGLGIRTDLPFKEAKGQLVEMFERVTGKLKEIAVAHSGQNVAVVLHGGVLDIINRFVRGNSLETPRDFLIPNAGLNWIAAVNGKWRLESWGETAHLEPGALDELPS